MSLDQHWKTQQCFVPFISGEAAGQCCKAVCGAVSCHACHHSVGLMQPGVSTGNDDGETGWQVQMKGQG